MQFRDNIAAYSEQPLATQVLLDVLKQYKRPYDKLDELVRQDMLVQLKRGLYIPGGKLKIAQPERFLVANHLHGPSYVSLDTALSHWGLIPERVFEISSVTTTLSKKYNTALGRFTYIHLPLPYYSFGILRVTLSKKQTVLMASKEKSLCDKIITTAGILLRSVTQTKELLVDDFRMDISMLRGLDSNAIHSWIAGAPKKDSLRILVKTLRVL